MLLFMCSIIVAAGGYILFGLAMDKFGPDSFLSTFGATISTVGMIAFIVMGIGMIIIAVCSDSDYHTKLTERAYLQYMVDNVEEDTPLDLKVSIYEDVIKFNESLEKTKRRHNSLWFNYLTPNYNGIESIDLEELENNSKTKKEE